MDDTFDRIYFFIIAVEYLTSDILTSIKEDSRNAKATARETTI